MKRKIASLLVLFIIATFAVAKMERNGFDRFKDQDFSRFIDNFPSQELSNTEKAALIKMREEEKLARDVYKVLYEAWGLRVFSNIARSEQRHTDSVKYLLQKYNIEDPVKDDTVGVFTNPKLAELYQTLVEKGLQSPADALYVGATIEDLDIYDLEELLIRVDNLDIVFVFGNLKKGSENHIRAFTYLLRNNYGIEYEAQYISQKELEKILNADGTGPYGGNGLGGGW